MRISAHLKPAIPAPITATWGFLSIMVKLCRAVENADWWCNNRFAKTVPVWANWMCLKYFCLSSQSNWISWLRVKSGQEKKANMTIVPRKYSQCYPGMATVPQWIGLKPRHIADPACRKQACMSQTQMRTLKSVPSTLFTKQSMPYIMSYTRSKRQKKRKKPQ